MPIRQGLLGITLMVCLALLPGCRDDVDEFIILMTDMSEVARDHQEDCSAQRAALSGFVDENGDRIAKIGGTLQGDPLSERDKKKMERAFEMLKESLGPKCQLNGNVFVGVIDKMELEMR